ncbi:MAG TPA: beta-ketoacyl synthase N-terminal-like domain-containing protein, partial [Chitinophagaceae bacterium]|nr:beta-ketoacyl synthase N-terminal-like domain-containing protein [Chitinophagaceae bacterium]
VLVVGCDVLTEFVVSGFNSFHALANAPCQPFDKDRSGVSLGEACACLLLSREALSDITLSGGAISNDANHISGPSKTGDELAWCIDQAMQEASVQPPDIGCISAHGTATPYNDEMESKAFEIAGLSNAPAFSLKANFGHTLGAAGVMEISLAAACLQYQCILPSAGFQNLGVSGQMTVSASLTQTSYQHLVKTGSGFGGCNAALVLSRVVN